MLHPTDGEWWGSLDPTCDNSGRKEGLGTLSMLPDQLVLRIFYTFPPEVLCAISLTSKAFFVFSSEEDIWKRLCLRTLDGDFAFKDTWKRTYLLPRDKAPQGPVPDIRIPGFYSEYLHKRWFRANVSTVPWGTIPQPQPPEKCVDRRSGLTLEEFRKEYAEKNRPVIITDVVTKWEAYKKWNEADLIARFGDTRFRTDQPSKKGDKVMMTMADYFQYLHNIRDSDPIYMFDPGFGERGAALLGDYEIPVYYQEDFFNSLTMEDRPYFRWIVIGPKRSGSPFHLDPFMTAAWNGLISGRKRWALYPPNETPAGCVRKKNKRSLAKSPKPIKWFLNTYPSTINTPARPIECILEPGEIIFVPTGWYHLVLNIEPTIAVTQNFCSRENFQDVYESLKSDKELHITFTDIITREQPHLLEKVKIPDFYYKRKRKLELKRRKKELKKMKAVLTQMENETEVGSDSETSTTATSSTESSTSSDEATSSTESSSEEDGEEEEQENAENGGTAVDEILIHHVPKDKAASRLEKDMAKTHERAL